MKARLILRHTRYDDETRVKPFHGAPDKNLPFCRARTSQRFTRREFVIAVERNLDLFRFPCFSLFSSVSLSLPLSLSLFLSIRIRA